MKTLLLCLLLLTGTTLHATIRPTRQHTRKYYAKQQRKAEHKHHVTPPKVHHAYDRRRNINSLITF